jgi:cytidylate kinase
MRLLGLISLANMVISYCIQCFTVLAVFHTDLDFYIDNTKQSMMDELSFCQHIDFKNLGFILGCFYLGIYVHAKAYSRARKVVEDKDIHMSETSSNSSIASIQKYYEQEPQAELVQMRQLQKNLWISFLLLS